MEHPLVPRGGTASRPELVRVGPRRARHRPRDTGTWLFGYAHSLVGDQVFYVALTWAAVTMMSPARVGLVLVAGSIPRAVVLLVGGVLVDRLGPKVVVIASDVLRTVVMVAAALVLGGGSGSVLLIGVLATAFGIVEGFFLPAVGAVPAFVTDLDGLTRLQAMRTVVYRAAPVVGAPLASWLLVRFGVASAFWVCAAMFAVSVVALAMTRMIRPRSDDAAADDEPEPGVLREVAQGLRLVVGDRRLLVLVLVSAILDFGLAGPTTVGVPLLAAEQSWGPAGIGWITGGFGVGAVLSAVALIWRRPAVRAGLITAVGLTLMGVGMVALGAMTDLRLEPSHSVVVAGLLGAVVGAGAGLFGATASAMVVAISPIAHLGRVMAVVSLAGYLGDPISFSLTGIAAGGLGASSVFLFGGGLIMVAVVIIWVSPAIRTIALPQPARPRSTESGARRR